MADPHRTPSRTARLRGPLLVGGGAAVLALALHVRDPHVQGSWGGCPWVALTGFYCPGCGVLRAVHDLTGGDVVAAASSNLVLVLAVPVLVGLWVRWATRAWTPPETPLAPVDPGRAALATRHPAVLVAAAAAVMVGFTVLRNLPGSWLAP